MTGGRNGSISPWENQIFLLQNSKQVNHRIFQLQPGKISNASYEFFCHFLYLKYLKMLFMFMSHLQSLRLLSKPVMRLFAYKPQVSTTYPHDHCLFCPSIFPPVTTEYPAITAVRAIVEKNRRKRTLCFLKTVIHWGVEERGRVQRLRCSIADGQECPQRNVEDSWFKSLLCPLKPWDLSTLFNLPRLTSSPKLMDSDD